MVFNATFNNISAISWRSVLLVKETGVPGENHQPVASQLISLQMVRMNIKTNIRTFRLTLHWYIFSTYLCTCYELNMLIY